MHKDVERNVVADEDREKCAAGDGKKGKCLNCLFVTTLIISADGETCMFVYWFACFISVACYKKRVAPSKPVVHITTDCKFVFISFSTV